MEMASAGSSMTDESGSSNNAAAAATAASPTADQSVNGLKFGKKIYFEDDHVSGGGAPIKSRISGSSSSTSGSGAARGRKGQGGQQQPPRCQVEGCKVDLSDAKSYYSRHKVCGMHSKYPKVIVAGLEQRFCQQCSRFHQLPEFDQGKRSCRRRLAGHNERRRKPPPGSLLSSRYGQFSPTMFGNSSRAGSFLMDFSAYPRQAGRDGPENQTAAIGRSVPHSWQSSSQNAPSNPYLQGATGGTCFSSSGVSSGECFTGISVSDSSCALSLLSNQPWGSRNRGSGLGVNDLLNAEGPSVAQSTDPRGAAVNRYLNPSWSYKRNEGSSNSHDMRPDLALGQISPPFNSPHEPSQHNRTQYMEVENSRAYDSTAHHIHWSL